MIEFLTDNNDALVVINPHHIAYIANDNGTAVIRMMTNEQFIVDDYNDVIARLRESNLEVHLDKEARDSLDSDEEE